MAEFKSKSSGREREISNVELLERLLHNNRGNHLLVLLTYWQVSVAGSWPTRIFPSASRKSLNGSFGRADGTAGGGAGSVADGGARGTADGGANGRVDGRAGGIAAGRGGGRVDWRFDDRSVLMRFEGLTPIKACESYSHPCPSLYTTVNQPRC